jgi:calcineurin-like phosphoesterase family protein
MERWFCSDWHLSHENIIRYSNRPFANAREMDEALVTYHNERVKPEDHYSMLGDVTMLRGGRVQQEQFIRLVKRFNGHGRLYLGNHDHFPVKTYLMAGFEKVYATWRSQENIIFSHYPVHPNSLGSVIANVHGHTHEKPDYPPHTYVNTEGARRVIPYVNICVERTNYHPISLEDLMTRIRDAKTASEVK